MTNEVCRWHHCECQAKHVKEDNMEKLWTVTVSVGFQVWAGSEEEAQHIARQFAGSEIVNGYGVVAAFPTVCLPDDWRASLPYGGVVDETCAELMDSNEVGRDA